MHKTPPSKHWPAAFNTKYYTPVTANNRRPRTRCWSTHGTKINGTVFDSSVQRGKPASFKVNEVVPGFSQAVQNMRTGGKWRVTIPAMLAYGPRGAGKSIGPNETLIFEIELLEIQ